MRARYWNEEAETQTRESLEERQLTGLRESVDRALRTPFYKERLEGSGIRSAADIRTLEDLERIPFTTKDDLRRAYPYGLLAVDRREVVRIHVSSGTTGTPTVIYHTQGDLDAWTELVARSIVATGADRSDVFQNMMTYGLFTGGLGLHYGAEKVGLFIIPASSGNTKRQFKLMKDFGTTVVHATPSYLLHLASRRGEEGIGSDDLALRKAYVGAEPHSENTRRRIEELFGIDVYNSYGLSEMNGPGVAFECIHKQGMHVWEDHYIMEVVGRETLAPMEEGREGELVLTTLKRTATPLLRYRTRDLTTVLPGSCACGRAHRRIDRIKGRTDDMLIVNGVNVFPSQIEEALMKMPEVGTNYQIQVQKRGALDQITVKTEVTPRTFSDDARDLNALRERIREEIRAYISINPVVELHEPGVLPVSEGKAVRVIDTRREV